MCLIALALGVSERYPFVIAANRDEFLDRPTAPLATWEAPSGITVVSGRDLRDGGIWMGFSPSGRFAMLTNVRQPLVEPPHQPISRGGLALSWLESAADVQTFAARLDPMRYQGFNLIVGNALDQQCFYLSNQVFLKTFEHLAVIKPAQSAMHLIPTEMPWSRLYGLSNAALDTPWPKTLQLKQALANGLDAHDADTLTAQCLAALANAEAAPESDLPTTGVNLELERALSSVFVRHPPDQPRYGTRTSLVAVLRSEDGLSVTEVTHSVLQQPDQIHRETRQGFLKLQGKAMRP